MNLYSQILFFFGALGVFNSFLISLYFIIIKKPKDFSNILFGIFLLFLSERALRSLIYFFSDATPNSYSAFGPITFIFIGPFLFLYVLTVLKLNTKNIKYWKYHIAFWIGIAIGIHFIYPFRSDPIFWKRYILVSINIQWLCYTLVSGYYLAKRMKNISQKEEKLLPINLWLAFLLLAVLILWLMFFFTKYSYFVIGSITFSVLFYSFFLYFLFNKKQKNQIFGDEKKYADKKIDNTTAKILIEKLDILMSEQKLYKDPNLKSSDIAKILHISTHQFSQFLNDNLGKSFPAFVNEYRIEEAKLIIRSNTKYTLDAIGNESGFNSKSTFYTVFKKLVGMTPAKYKEQF